MKKTILFILLVSFFGAAPLSAQTIHVLIAADGRAGFGANMAADARNMENVFTNHVPKSQLNLIVMDRSKVDPENILKSVTQFDVKADDTLVVYYSGHAAHDVGNGGHYFQFRDGNGKTSELTRRTLLAKMQEKNARLLVLLTDCCNVEMESTGERKEKPQEYPGKLPNQIAPLFQTLFLNAKGVVDITSSKKGEASFIDSSEKKRGSCFTYPLAALLEKHKDNLTMNWPKLVQELKIDVQKAFEESWPEGFKFDPPINGISLQKTQTVDVYGSLPGTESRSTESTQRQGPRFGVRAVNNGGNGVRITEVVKDGPGATAGFEVGDVILEINGTPIRNEKDYSDAIDNSPRRMKAKVLNVNDKNVILVTFDLGW